MVSLGWVYLFFDLFKGRLRMAFTHIENMFLRV
jgi:hypothetical protein